MRIYKRKHRAKTTWCVDYVHPITRRRIRTAIGTRKEAELALAKIRLDVVRGDTTPDIPMETSILSFKDKYFNYVKQIHKPETYRVDFARFKVFEDFIRACNLKTLQEITPATIAIFQTNYLQNHSRKSWNNLLGLLKTIINRAVDWNMIGHNPIARVPMLKLDKTYHYFTTDQIRLIMHNAPEPLFTALLILLNTGIRRGELWQLRYRDIDLKARKLKIRPSEAFSPKSRKIRVVPLREPVVRHLSQNRHTPDDRLCSSFVSENAIHKQFMRLLKKLDLPGTLHDCRHTFASHLAMAGTPIPVISELLGHADIKTTMIYAHLSPGIHQAEVDKLTF